MTLDDYLFAIATAAIAEDYAEVYMDDHGSDARVAYERLSDARKARRDAVVAYLNYLRVLETETIANYVLDEV